MYQGVSVYDGGFAERPEDEREAEWEDPFDGDLPWEPNPVEKPQPWERPKWGGTPEEQMYRDLMDEDDEGEG